MFRRILLERVLHEKGAGKRMMAAKASDLAETRKGSEPPSHGAASPGGQRDSTLKIAIVDESPIRAAILEDGLREAGFTLVERITETRNLLTRVYALDPDVILIDLESPSRDVLEQMFQMSRAVKRPIAMFVDQSDSASIQAAVDNCNAASNGAYKISYQKLPNGADGQRQQMVRRLAAEDSAMASTESSRPLTSSVLRLAMMNRWRRSKKVDRWKKLPWKVTEIGRTL